MQITSMTQAPRQYLGLEHVYADVDDVGQQLLIVEDLLEVLLDGVSDLVLRGQEHGEVLRLLQGLGVGHHLQELGRPASHSAFRGLHCV